MPENSKQALATNDFWGLSGEHRRGNLRLPGACERRNLRNQGALAKRLFPIRGDHRAR